MEQAFHHLLKHTEEHFSGWDFSYITETGRVQTSLLSWSYGSKARSYMEEATSLLDMGTGGGEFLSLLRPFPEVVKATEGYKPNVPIARKRLEPLGVQVYEFTEDQHLPFADEEFDLILNKHESFDAKEIHRILSEKGTFITQQVGGTDCRQINEWFNQPLSTDFAEWSLVQAKAQLEEAGLTITHAVEEFPTQRFYDLGAILYYLKAIPWQMEHWEPQVNEDQLYKLYLHIKEKGYFDVTQHRFMLIGHKG